MLADLCDCKRAGLVLRLVMTFPSRSDTIKIGSFKKA